MKKTIRLAFLATLAITLLAGCGKPAATTGGIDFQMDLSALQDSRSRAETPIITRVAVTLTKEGEQTIQQDLPIAGNIASGRIDGLAPGYWHVVAEAYENEILLFSGSADVLITARRHAVYYPLRSGRPESDHGRFEHHRGPQSPARIQARQPDG